MRGLVIKSPWIDKILAGEKTWELRGTRVNIRGLIALIKSGSGQVVGICEVDGYRGPLTASDFKKNIRRHRVTCRLEEVGYANTYAWVLKNARPLDPSIAYRHPPGAITWVNLSGTKAAREIQARKGR